MKSIQHVTRMGDQLVQAGLITQDQLKLALDEQKRVNEHLGRILVNLGFISEITLAKTLADLFGIPFISLKNTKFDRELLRTFPSDLARKHLLIPIMREEDGNVRVAMANPSNVLSVDAVQEFLGVRINIAAALESEISDAISSMMEREKNDAPPGLEETEHPEGIAAKTLLHDMSSNVEIVDRIIEYALRNHATDIHFEPEKKLLRIRYRIDGTLHPGETFPLDMLSLVLTRVKILSGLDITERRLPQDGRISMDYNQRTIDFRVSTMPTAHGENIVIRILDRGSISLDLKDLGLSSALRQQLIDMANQPYGMILVSGPTGSGKTTTMYALLLCLDSMAKKIVTIEDPIEYELPLIRQSQVDPGIHYTFADGLRTILRQDPDVILVGEIRDHETAEVAMRASLTGHIVLASIHTNTAIGAIPRLLDIGIDPFLINSSLSGVLAQRLVRKTCKECREPYRPTQSEADWLGIDSGTAGTTLYKAKGCALCRSTGYSKRTALFELFKMDDDFASLVTQSADEKGMEAMARQKGMAFMKEDGKQKVLEGITTTQEVLRVCQSL
ncbi:MAG: ATPase, T2SS/T4P/T4SS family [Planctomycetota bacterium]